MQDRFKFRIWDKFCETWLTDFAINQDGEINRFFNNEEALKRRFVLMQSTGLKDKNGKLIYEGDLVRYAEYEIEEIEPEWEYTEIVWGGNHHYPTFDLKIHEFDCNGLSYIFNEGWTIEVVGNIYENKELLNE